jgi:hypothetical protein
VLWFGTTSPQNLHCCSSIRTIKLADHRRSAWIGEAIYDETADKLNGRIAQMRDVPDGLFAVTTLEELAQFFT